MTSLLLLALTFAAPPEPILFEIAQRIELPEAPNASTKARLWIPIPIDADGQALIRFEVPQGGKLTRDPTLGNRFVYLEYGNESPRPKLLELKYVVRRSAVVVDSKSETLHPTAPDVLQRWLKPDPVHAANTDLTALAQRIGGDGKDAFAKGKAFYEHVFDHMTYDKNEPGWGQANVKRACEVGKGNCTDFHGLFVALSQAAKIPARLEMGLTLPIKDSAGYHCWASFYAGKQGWVPVDISDPRKSVKDPKSASEEQRLAGFGKLTAERIVMGKGIEAPLSPPASKPVRFVLGPVLEIDGNRVADDQINSRWTSTIIKEQP